MRGSGEAVESEAAGMEKRLWGRGRRHPETRALLFPSLMTAVIVLLFFWFFRL